MWVCSCGCYLIKDTVLRSFRISNDLISFEPQPVRRIAAIRFWRSSTVLNGLAPSGRDSFSWRFEMENPVPELCHPPIRM